MERFEKHEAAGVKDETVREMGRVALGAAGFANNAEEYRKVPEFTAQNVKEYCLDRRLASMDVLKRKSPDLAEVYRNVIRADGALRIIAVEDEDIQNNAYFNKFGYSGGRFRPEVRFNFGRPETYTEPSMEFTLKRIALEIGARDEDVMNNKKLVSAFVFLHEMGHGADFINNYLIKERGQPLEKALEAAGLKNQKQRLRDEMTMPIPGQVEGTLDEKLGRFKRRLTAMGIRSKKQLRAAMERAYREKSGERVADEFARDYIMEHYDDFFLKPNEPDDGSGRIRTGELIKMGEDFAEVLGMKEGMYMRLEKTGQRGKSDVPVGFMREGFLLENMEFGASIVLNPAGDPEDRRSQLSTSQVMQVFRQKMPDGKTKISIHTLSGAIYEAYKSRKVVPKTVVETAGKLNSTLGVSAGSKVQLMKQRLKAGADSMVQEGQVIFGELKAPIKSGESVKFDGGSQTSPVVGVYRQWKTWYVATESGSFYEVLPM